MRIAIVLSLVCITFSLSAQLVFSGVLHQTEEELLYTEDQNWKDFQAQAEAMAAQGFRLKDVESILEENERKYWGIWVKSGLDSRQESMMGWNEVVKKKREMVDEGYVLADIEGAAQSEADHEFVGVWYKGDTPHKVWKLDSRDGIDKKTQEMADQNFYLVDVECFTTPSKAVVFLALYHFGQVTSRSFIFASTDLKAFNTDLLQRSKSGYQLIDYEKFEENGQIFYLGVYRKGDYQSVLLRDLDRDDFDGTWEQKEREGLKLIDLEIYQKPTADDQEGARAGK